MHPSEAIRRVSLGRVEHASRRTIQVGYQALAAGANTAANGYTISYISSEPSTAGYFTSSGGAGSCR